MWLARLQKQLSKMLGSVAETQSTTGLGRVRAQIGFICESLRHSDCGLVCCGVFGHAASCRFAVSYCSEAQVRRPQTDDEPISPKAAEQKQTAHITLRELDVDSADLLQEFRDFLLKKYPSLVFAWKGRLLSYRADLGLLVGFFGFGGRSQLAYRPMASCLMRGAATCGSKLSARKSWLNGHAAWGCSWWPSRHS